VLGKVVVRVLQAKRPAKAGLRCDDELGWSAIAGEDHLLSVRASGARTDCNLPPTWQACSLRVDRFCAANTFCRMRQSCWGTDLTHRSDVILAKLE
jgi:hypothetical protein